MNFHEKIAVFDLDGTLWKENSHYEILCEYFGTNFYKSLFFRVFRRFFAKCAYQFICKKYEEIPKEYAYSFLLCFDSEIVSLLKSKQGEGFFCVIVSNAPQEIIINAASKLNVAYLKAPIGSKKIVLDENFSYKKLFVCTDNIEDIDLVSASDSRKIIFTAHNKKFFERAGFCE